MAQITTDDGVTLYYEEAGRGTPIVFVHEFSGDWRSFEPQMRHFARTYRCITYSARGYLPSDVPEDPKRYSQDRAVADLLAILDGLKLERAHVVGLSMGAFATLHFGMTHGHRALSITVAGGGYGSHPAQYKEFQTASRNNAELIRKKGMAAFVDAYGVGPQRVQLEIKDARGFAEYLKNFKEHSALGAINTLLGVQCRRPSFYDLTAEMARVEVPALILSGDEEEPCIEVNLLMKRTIPGAALALLPRSGHAINLEEPALFNQLVEDFFRQVETGRYTKRDKRSTVPSIYGPSGKP